MLYQERIWTANELKTQVQQVLFTPPTGKYFSFARLIFEYEEGSIPYTNTSSKVMVSLGNTQAAYFSMGSLMGAGKPKAVQPIYALNSEIVDTSLDITLTQAFEINEEGTGPDLQVQFLGSGTNPQDGDGIIRVKFYYDLETFGTNL